MTLETGRNHRLPRTGLPPLMQMLEYLYCGQLEQLPIYCLLLLLSRGSVLLGLFLDRAETAVCASLPVHCVSVCKSVPEVR